MAKHTKPELVVRLLVFGMSYRYRLHAKLFPGYPDLFFPGRKKALHRSKPTVGVC